MQTFMSEWWQRVIQESVPINPLNINWKIVALAANGMCWHFNTETGGMNFQYAKWSAACDLIERYGGQVMLEEPERLQT